MAKIVLGVGCSHSPMLNGTAEEWSWFAAREPGMKLLDRDGRPSSYAALVAEAGGRFDAECTPARLASRHAAAQAALDRVEQAIGAAKLDCLVIVGDDQKELFLDDNNPALLVYTGETIHHKQRPPKPDWVDWFAAMQSRNYVEQGAIDYPVAHALARHLVAHLTQHEFDVATCARLPRGEGEGHAFAFVHKRLMRGGAPLPVLPVFLNTYYPPNQPTPARCYRVGEAIKAAVEAFDAPLRVGILGSGGLTHFAIDEAFDREIIRALREKDARALSGLPQHKLNSGNSEIRNWVALAGAASGLAVDWLDYIPAYRSPAGTGTGLCFAVWR
jgi:3-O-methylgallate 3,4-dioxygenase